MEGLEGLVEAWIPNSYAGNADMKDQPKLWMGLDCVDENCGPLFAESSLVRTGLPSAKSAGRAKPNIDGRAMAKKSFRRWEALRGGRRLATPAIGRPLEQLVSSGHSEAPLRNVLRASKRLPERP